LGNYLAPNLTAKKEILYALQENVAKNVPIVYLVRQDLISVNRNDNWENWFNELGGPCTWINEYSIREVTPVGSETQLKIGTLMLMNNLNMVQSALTDTNAGSLYLMMVYENLVGFPKVDEASLESNPDAAYDFIPKLATNYEVSYQDDGAGGQNQVWTIDLREGVKWQDYETEGIYLTADDVVYTMKYVLSKWLADMPVNWTAVEENNWDILSEHVLVEKTGDYQIKMTYVEGWHQNEDFFPSEFMWYAVVPEHIFNAEDAPENPLSWDGNSIGTGPYKVKEWVPDDYILFERFGDYWGAGDEYWGLPAAQQVLWKLYADIGSLFLALESGEIDAAMGTSAQFEKKAEYEANPDLTVEVVPDLSINYLGFNLHPTEGYAPLQDLTLRKAIAAAIDKENIVDIAFGGYGETCDAWTYNESPNHKDDLPNNEYDPTEAESILLAAGYTYVE
jgi:peptide/nickel transport system substrate-binding protein